MIPAEPVQKNNRGTAARALVVELEFPDADAAGSEPRFGSSFHDSCLGPQSTIAARDAPKPCARAIVSKGLSGRKFLRASYNPRHGIQNRNARGRDQRQRDARTESAYPLRARG